MTYFERQERFKVWCDDLEQRLAWHLFCYREPDLTLTRLVEVVENDSRWDVYLNGVKMFQFIGNDAYSRATRVATDLANGK